MKKVMSLLTIHLLSLLAIAAPQLGDDGYYSITSAEDLQWFAQKVNSGDNKINGRLEANIDYTSCTDLIGNANMRYGGTFDGQGHSITVNINSTQSYTALFTYLTGTIRNLTVEGVVASSAKLAAGIAGQGDPSSLIENCVSKVTLKPTVTGDATNGGIVGHSWGVTIKNCAFTGKIVSETSNNCGGLAGWCDGYTRIENSLMAGSFEILDGDNNLFGRRPGNVSLTNCYYLPTKASLTNDGAKELSPAALASGEACYKLNGTQAPAIWYQTIGTDAIPVPNAEGHLPVYAIGQFNCDGTPKSGDLTYNNMGGTVIPDHEFNEGFCVNCGQADPDILKQDEDGFYLIGKAYQLKAFALKVNAGETTINARLTGDIDYSAGTDVIGLNNMRYAGTFDGQNHRITVNFSTGETYYGLFRYLTGTVQNLTVDGNITTSGRLAAGIVAYTGKGAVLKNCISLVNITSSCVGNATDGGIIAHSYGATLDNCAFLGKITSESSTDAGGMVGWCDGATILNNCLVAAAMEFPKTDANNIFSPARNITLRNCYYTPTNGVQKLAGATELAAEAIASGEACYKLNGDQTNMTWYQTIGTDVYPVPNAEGHGIVYAAGDMSCDGTMKEGAEYTYNNTGGSEIPDHEYENGFCKNCGQPDPNYMDIDEDGYYLISNAEQLNAFAKKVNAGETAINARLTADIDYSEYNDAIGNNTWRYAGIFDGQEHTITVDFITSEQYFALFRYASGTICNLIVDGRLETTARLAGGIVAYAVSGLQMKNCISKVDISSACDGNATDGGLIAHSIGATLTNCAYMGTIESTNSTNCCGVVGWSDGATTLVNCVMTGKLNFWDTNNNNVFSCPANRVVLKNCYYVEGNAVQNLAGGTALSSVKAMETGEACYLLNGDQTAMSWFQTLSEDSYPVPFASHGVIYKISEGYADYHDDESFEAYCKYVIESETEYANSVIATDSLITNYLTKLESMEELEKEAFLEAVAQLKQQRKAIEASANAYQEYQATIDATKERLETDDSFFGDKRDLLEEYLESDEEPNEKWINGGYIYIIDSHMLSAEDILKEKTFVENLLNEALSQGFQKGADITSLLVNADFKDGFNGWQGVTGNGTTLSGTTGMVGAEAWAKNFDMHQTITDLKNGVYMMSMTSGFRPHNSVNSTNYAASIYAGENMTYMPTVGETYIKVDEIIDGINCNLTVGSTDLPVYDENGELLGYAMHGTVSVANAAAAGRAMTYILTEVTDSTLTVGMRNPGAGHGNDWTGMANIHLYYLGALEDAQEQLDLVLQGQADRANTIINTINDTGAEYMMSPAISAALKSKLNETVQAIATAETAESKYALIQQFTDLFNQVYECKKAYVSMINAAEKLANALNELSSAKVLTDEQYNELYVEVENVWTKYINGSYSQEEANEVAAKMGENCYPAQKNGVYQIGSTLDMAFFSHLVNSGTAAHANAELIADIDYPYYKMNAYYGKFDGNYHTLTLDVDVDNVGVAATMIESLYGTFCNVILRGTMATTSGWTAPIAFRTYAGSRIENVQSYVTINSSMVGGTANTGFIVQDATGVVIKNCLFGGQINGAQSNCNAGFIGWSDGSSVLTNCLQISINEADANGSNTFVRGKANYGNCFYLEPFGAVPSATQTTTEQMASGELCHKLNALSEENVVWTQTIGVDPFPVPNPNGQVVYLVDGLYTNDKEDGIQGIFSSEDKTSQGIYNLSGQRLNRVQKGLNIVNGKKIVF